MTVVKKQIACHPMQCVGPTCPRKSEIGKKRHRIQSTATSAEAFHPNIPVAGEQRLRPGQHRVESEEIADRSVPIVGIEKAAVRGKRKVLGGPFEVTRTGQDFRRLQFIRKGHKLEPGIVLDPCEWILAGMRNAPRIGLPMLRIPEIKRRLLRQTACWERGLPWAKTGRAKAARRANAPRIASSSSRANAPEDWRAPKPGGKSNRFLGNLHGLLTAHWDQEWFRLVAGNW